MSEPDRTPDLALRALLDLEHVSDAGGAALALGNIATGPGASPGNVQAAARQFVAALRRHQPILTLAGLLQYLEDPVRGPADVFPFAPRLGPLLHAAVAFVDAPKSDEADRLLWDAVLMFRDG